jgi:transcriptional accessory protein Tex/SPT6
VVQVRVLGVDMEQKRISLSMKKGAPQGVAREGRNAGGQGQQGRGPGGKPGKQAPKQPKATVDQLLQKFAAAGPQRQNNVKLAVSLKSLMRSGR